MNLAPSQMASPALGEIGELTLCSSCKRTFDDVERQPKLLSCKHHFCLACARGVLLAGREVLCMHCWKRTELPGGQAAALPTHGAVLALARRLAGPSPLLRELARLAARQRDLLLRALDAATELNMRLEAELAAPAVAPAAVAVDSRPAAAAEREHLRAQHAEALVQCRLDDLVRTATVPLDFELLERTLTGLGPIEIPLAPSAASERRDPLLLLGNYCTAAVFARSWATPAGGEAEVAADAGASPSSSASSASAVASPLLRNPGMFPLFYFELEVNGAPIGRIVIEVRDDVAPRMARNFSVLTSGELGVGYRGCAVFQCWENESVITGDFELNNGRGGRSVFEESYFMPDDTRMAAVRGSVGMRRSQKRRDRRGLVGSQFRIVLREMRGFTAIFASVVEGLELVDRLSRAGDSAGKPHSAILIASCGKLS